jgi:hypothetical protein
VETKTAEYTLVDGDIGVLIRLDTTSGNVDAVITEAMSADYAANAYFYVVKAAAANTASIIVSGSTTLNGVTASLALTHNAPVRIWRKEADVWYTF